MRNRRHDRARRLIHCLLMLALLATATLGAKPQDKRPQDRLLQDKSGAAEQWASPREYIAGTERSRLTATKSLGAASGRWIIAYLSIGCSDCDAVVPSLNSMAARSRVLGVAVANEKQIEQWRKKHNAAFPVRRVSERTFEDLGAVVLPTIVLFENGQATGARAPSLEDTK